MKFCGSINIIWIIFVDIDVLVLLSCNTGHYSISDSKIDNFAGAFSEKVTGIVVAPSGTLVVSKDNFFDKSMLMAIVNENKKSTSSDNSVRYGWVIYRYCGNRVRNFTSIATSGITVEELYSYINARANTIFK